MEKGCRHPCGGRRKQELMADDGGGYVAPFLEASSWRACSQQLACVSTMVGTEDVEEMALSG